VRVHALAALGLAAVLTGAATAAPEPPDDPSLAGPTPTTLTGYLASADIDGARIIGPPPGPDTPRGRGDRAFYNEARSLADSPRWKAAQRDNDLWNGGAITRYACALGVRLDATATPVTHRLLARVELDVRTVSGPAKHLYNRTRPLIGDDLPVCVPRQDWMKTNASYPSGHAMTGWAWSLVLTEVAPAKANGLLAAGRDVGDSRPICGVHFRTDVEAGRTLAAAMVARLHGEPAFLRDMAQAKAELAAARAAPAGCPLS
jgi:acid phosphatase (class A)